MRFFGGNRPEAEPDTLTDEQALARYRYLLETAPPEDIERAHAEAFARLTPEQRRKALEALAGHVPPTEIRGDDPEALARTITRAEIARPGTIERAWGGPTGAAIGLGSWFIYGLAGSFIGTAIAQSLFDAGDAGDGGDVGGGDGSAGDAEGADGWDGGTADAGDVGGDFGGGDFGGGDFGGF
jgi:hypothetical protein